MSNVHKHIEHSVSRRKKGSIVFPTDFRNKGSQAAIKMALSRLSKSGELNRLSQGVCFT